MKFTQLIAVLSLTELLSTVGAFSVGSSHAKRSHRRKTSVKPLLVATSLDFESDEAAFVMMQRARECADSDTCSVEEAEEFLSNILHVQSGCASGALVGREICEDQDVAAEIVAGLRAKIAKGVSGELSVVNAGTQLLKVSVVTLLLSMIFFSTITVQPGATPFTPQEWWWALQGGYLNTMLEHYVKHGGLSVVDYEATAVPFTMQEWWWSIKGGYFDRMFAENFQMGGLVISDYQEDVIPITLQEWWWAISGGFLHTMILHNFKNGGLLTSVEYQPEVIPFTTEEWVWAAKGGYLNDMVENLFRKGGM